MHGGDDAGLQLPDEAHELEPVELRFLDAGVGEVEHAMLGHAHDLRGGIVFPLANLGCAARAAFAACERESGRAITHPGKLDQRAGTAQFDIIGMCGEGEKVNGHVISMMLYFSICKDHENEASPCGFQQSFCFLQIRRVKAFGKPVIDFGQ